MIWNEEMIRAELKRLDRKTGLNGAKLPIKFTHSKHTLGCFYPEKDNMRFDFSLYYLSDDSFPEEEALDLIRHEYAHFANFCLYHGTGHDRMWRKCCSDAGSRGIWICKKYCPGSWPAAPQPSPVPCSPPGKRRRS